MWANCAPAQSGRDNAPGVGAPQVQLLIQPESGICPSTVDRTPDTRSTPVRHVLTLWRPFFGRLSTNVYLNSACRSSSNVAVKYCNKTSRV